MVRRVLMVWLVLANTLAFAALPGSRPPAERAGEALYRTGKLPDGTPVTAERDPGMAVAGATAACVNCHKRSGLGTREGQVRVPPIAGMYLFHPRAGTVDNLDLPFVEGMKPDRDPYTDATLARAIREGIGGDGMPLNYLMPRYTLADAPMASLIGYLRQLSPTPMPGVDGTTLHFATIITPEADPLVQKGVLDVLNRFFEDKNHYTRSQGPRMQSSHRMMFKANRHWQLHVWQLSGPPSGWQAQLRARLAAQPVLAVIGSTGGSHWEPVHRFCEAAELPCLFPIVDLPVDDDAAFDNLYFSRGVLLEADLMARDLRARQGEAAPRRVVQIYRVADAGEGAAARLSRSLAGGVPSIDRALPAKATARDLATAVAKAEPGDALVLWLRATDIAALGKLPAGVRLAYVSARMAGMEAAPLAADWRAVSLMAYPFDLPEHRRVQVDYPRGWFRLRGIAVVAEQAQGDAYFACAILSDTLNHMADTFVRDYLVERVEEAVAHRILTGYYPRLTLAPGQRFASKGGYLVRFPEGAGTRVVPVGDWTTP